MPETLMRDFEVMMAANLGADIERVYASIEAYALFHCAHCEADLLGRWQFCPNCGGAIVWADFVAKAESGYGTDAGTDQG